MTITMPVWASPLVERLGWTLVHFLWEGALVAAVLWGVLMAARGVSARVRYWVSIAAMALLVGMPVGTFWGVGGGDAVKRGPTVMVSGAVERGPAVVRLAAPAVPGQAGQPVRGQGAIPAAAKAPPAEGPAIAVPVVLQNIPAVKHWDFGWLMPWCVGVWAIGVFAMGVWHLGGWLVVQRLRRVATRPVGGAARGAVRSIAAADGDPAAGAAAGVGARDYADGDRVDQAGDSAAGGAGERAERGAAGSDSCARTGAHPAA